MTLLHKVRYPISSLEFKYATGVDMHDAQTILQLAVADGLIKFDNGLYWPDDGLIRGWRLCKQ